MNHPSKQHCSRTTESLTPVTFSHAFCYPIQKLSFVRSVKSLPRGLQSNWMFWPTATGESRFESWISTPQPASVRLTSESWLGLWANSSNSWKIQVSALLIYVRPWIHMHRKWQVPVRHGSPVSGCFLTQLPQLMDVTVCSLSQTGPWLLDDANKHLALLIPPLSVQVLHGNDLQLWNRRTSQH